MYNVIKKTIFVLFKNKFLFTKRQHTINIKKGMHGIDFENRQNRGELHPTSSADLQQDEQTRRKSKGRTQNV
jgi:hypothetical protein